MWAAAFTAWGPDNREGAVRIASPFWGQEANSINFEIKASDPGNNPYLALGGGLYRTSFDMDDPRIMRAMSEMERDMEHLDENNPRHMAHLMRKMKEALLNLHASTDGQRVLEQFGALKFIETTVEDYKPVFEMAKNAGIDIKSYDYRNK